MRSTSSTPIGFENEKSVLALLGAGFALGLDGTMLKTLPDILRKTPEVRIEFEQLVLGEFEKTLT